MDFLDIFGQLDDPRIERKKLQPMPEILLLTLCAVICGSDSWGDIETFGKSKLNFLRRYLPYEHGIPSDDTLRQFFRKGLSLPCHLSLSLYGLTSFACSANGSNSSIRLLGQVGNFSKVSRSHAAGSIPLSFAVPSRV